MTKKNEYILSEIIRELIKDKEVFATEAAIRERYNKLKEIGILFPNDEKNQKRQIVIYADEVDLLKALLIEAGEPFLIRLTSKNRVGKPVEEELKEAEDFRKRMQLRAKKIDGNHEVKEKWERMIEGISHYQVRILQQNLIEKLRFCAASLSEKNLSYQEMVDILETSNRALDEWIKKYIE